jgi:ribose transport system permease protein
MSQTRSVTASAEKPPLAARPEAAPVSTWVARVRQAVSFQKVGALYVLLAMVIVFSVWVPDTFPHWDTARQILNNNAVGALAALALIIPLAAGVFDISVPYTMTLSGVMCTYTIAHTSLPLGVAILLTMLVALGVGLLNGIVVVIWKIDSLIGTLATGFLIQALVKWRTGSTIVTSGKLSGTFSDLSHTKWLFDLTLPVFYAFVVALGLWYVLEHTATGRRIYATGFNREATRLASVRTERIRFGALVTSSLLAGFAGIVMASNLGSGSPNAGGEYLLPAFAAVFLGATQLKNGRFNAWGTIIGIILLGTGTTGLGLANVELWVQDTFRGCVLIASLAITGWQVRKAGAATKRSWLRRRSPQGITEPVS